MWISPVLFREKPGVVVVARKVAQSQLTRFALTPVSVFFARERARSLCDLSCVWFVEISNIRNYNHRGRVFPLVRRAVREKQPFVFAEFFFPLQELDRQFGDRGFTSRRRQFQCVNSVRCVRSFADAIRKTVFAFEIRLASAEQWQCVSTQHHRDCACAFSD
jgi:hypothetical protein